MTVLALGAGKAADQCFQEKNVQKSVPFQVRSNYESLQVLKYMQRPLCLQDKDTDLWKTKEPRPQFLTVIGARVQAGSFLTYAQTTLQVSLTNFLYIYLSIHSPCSTLLCAQPSIDFDYATSFEYAQSYQEGLMT